MSTQPPFPPSSSTVTATGPGTPATGRAEDEDGYLWFEGRTDDVIISAGYRIGPFEVESALVSHPAWPRAAAVAAPTTSAVKWSAPWWSCGRTASPATPWRASSRTT